MSLHSQAVYNILSSSTGVTALVGKRIYPNILPQTTRNRDKSLPAVMFEQNANPQDHNMGTDDTPEHPSYTIHAYSGEYEEADDIRDAIITAMKDYSGSAGHATVQRAFYTDAYDNYLGADNTFDLMAGFIVWIDRSS